MIRPFLFALVLVLVSAAPGRTQDVPLPGTSSAPGSTLSIDDIRQAYRIHAGPFYVNPTLMLKQFGVDSNVFNEPVDPKSDFTFTVTPTADIAMPVARRGLITSTVAVDAVYYATYATERSLDPQVTVRGEAYAHRLTFFAQDGYLNTRQRPNYEIDLRSRHLDNDFTGGVLLSVTPKTSIELSGQVGKIRYAGDAVYFNQSLQQTLDEDSSGYTVALRDRLTPLTTVSLRYEDIHQEFPLSPDRNSNSYRIMPGVEFKPKALINGSAYVGYRSFTPTNSLIAPYTGLVAQLGLSYTLLGATTFGVTFNRDVSYSYEVANPYYLETDVALMIRRELTGRFDVIVTGGRYRYRYQQLGSSTPTDEPQRIDTTDNYAANVGYRLKGRTRVGFGASYSTRNSSTQAFRQYDGFRIGTTATYGF